MSIPADESAPEEQSPTTPAPASRRPLLRFTIIIAIIIAVSAVSLLAVAAKERLYDPGIVCGCLPPDPYMDPNPNPPSRY